MNQTPSVVVASKVVEVAVAVILAPNRQVLLAQRPAGKPMAGYWEFPGGKLEPGESVFDALKREIDEELGIVVEHADPWVVLPFVYPHATVRLHFMRVTRWSGVPHAREQQAFRFEPIDQFAVEPWLPGALPLKRWLQLPARYAISNAAELGIEPFLEKLTVRLAAGSSKCAAEASAPFWLQLREPTLDRASFEHLFAALLPICRTAGIRLLVSSRHPASFWSEADGVHVTARDLEQMQTRPAVQWCIASAHEAAHLERAAAFGADAALFGNVMATRSHPGRAALGWQGFAEVVRSTPLPVFALGGLDFSEHAQSVALAHGAHGIAAQRAAF
jgi:8-oxo-dGTP diphosphatase